MHSSTCFSLNYLSCNSLKILARRFVNAAIVTRNKKDKYRKIYPYIIFECTFNVPLQTDMIINDSNTRVDPTLFAPFIRASALIAQVNSLKSSFSTNTKLCANDFASIHVVIRWRCARFGASQIFCKPRWQKIGQLDVKYQTA